MVNYCYFKVHHSYVTVNRHCVGVNRKRVIYVQSANLDGNFSTVVQFELLCCLQPRVRGLRYVNSSS